MNSVTVRTRRPHRPGESAGFGLVEGDFPPEVQAELKRADEAYTRAVTLLLLARIAQGSLPPDTAIGLGSATVTVPSGATDCPPVAVAVPSFLFYVPPALLSMPDGPQQLEYPLIGPKALLVHALQQV